MSSTVARPVHHKRKDKEGNRARHEEENMRWNPGEESMPSQGQGRGGDMWNGRNKGAGEEAASKEGGEGDHGVTAVVLLCGNCEHFTAWKFYETVGRCAACMVLRLTLLSRKACAA